ncbi:MAG TPA: IS110 family transposase [Verrucomicrobiae bacterium]|nr:IS110 family transposase [Verrucomicrobiae bacterium]
MEQSSIPKLPIKGRVVGFDCHPDTFTAALLQGQTPAEAIVQKVFNKVPLGHLSSWAKKHLSPDDVIVLEASGNSFEVARRFQANHHQALVLESCQLGKLKEAHANNDRISAVRIGKAFLAGTAKVVWIPDAKTQERRDVMHAHRKAVKRHTQMINRLDSYLSDNGVRLEASLKALEPQAALAQIRQAKEWSTSRWLIIESFMAELQAAGHVRQKWEQAMAMEVISDPLLLSLTRLSGLRAISAYCVGAVIGDIARFKRPKSLVNYLGLHPCFDDSGNEQWSGGVGGHGRKDLRSLLIESAQCILNTASPLARWGRRLMAKKGSRNLAAAAVARKLAIAIWYLLQGKWEGLQNIDPALSQKIGKIISQVGSETLQNMQIDRKTLRQQTEQSLKSGRVYQLDPTLVYKPKPRESTKPLTLAEEHGPEVKRPIALKKKLSALSRSRSTTRPVRGIRPQSAGPRSAPLRSSGPQSPDAHP